ncbi:hypothetical protein [Pseudoramibacter sp.]|jgi:hypothetical protein|uniref:hypothetical protein n=1 Tax=Pseudoramibacter sp. TaxID=2034862 RepID=UPI0025D9BB50|nr:hypothetical protein [Pseudoramibacter sp.]MCH4072138.1 hypothetical protein [Pseudoramibacter sp.]MCH4105908.1 hypothetical protein [Pseudoramibacter sp.]
MTLSVFHYRDLSLCPVPGGTIVMAADSCASTGEKPGDTLKCPPYHCGRVSARVVLFELLCIGAQVLMVADGVCSEMQPTGLEIICGFQDEMKLAGLPPEMLTGSTEENFTTMMTGVGTAAVGYFPGNFKAPVCRSGDLLVSVGEPAVGLDFLHQNAPVATYEMIQTLSQDAGVHELIPVGSHGLAWEGRSAAALHHLKADFDMPCGLDLSQSGGPASCVLAVMSEEAFKRRRDQMLLTPIGHLKQNP